MKNNSKGEPRQLKQTLKVIFDNTQEGDILMNVTETNWRELEKGTSGAQESDFLKNAARVMIKEKKQKPTITIAHQIYK